MLTLLIADDEEFMRKALKIVVNESKEAKVVGEAISSQITLELCTELKPDLVILDEKIPGSDIQMLIQQIKEIDEEKIIIVVTDHDTLQKKMKMLKAGADDTLTKPINRKKVHALLERYARVHSFETKRPIPSSSSVVDEMTIQKENNEKREIQFALQYIEENFQNGVTLEEVADHVHLSPFYLSKLFKKELNVNFVSYVMERKMEKAKELLAQTDLPIIHIALELNYQEANYFSKVFKKVTGTTPTEFRKQLQTEKIHSSLLKKHHSLANGNWHI